MKILRSNKHPNAMTVLVTASDLDITQLCKNFNVVQWGESGMMPKNALIQEISDVHGLLCLVSINFYCYNTIKTFSKNVLLENYENEYHFYFCFFSL